MTHRLATRTDDPDKPRHQHRHATTLGVHADIPMPSEDENVSKTMHGCCCGACCAMMKIGIAAQNILEDPHDEIFFCHVASGLLIVGDNMHWFYTTPVPLLLRVRAGITQGQMGVNVKSIGVRDRPAVVSAWNKILNLPFTTITGFHELPGIVINNDTPCTHGDTKAALRQLVERSGQLSLQPPASGCTIL